MIKNIFGTDGIRAKISKGLFTYENLPLLGSALGEWVTQKYSSPTLCIAYDTRASAEWVKATLLTGLLLHPIKIFDAGILPTPALHNVIAKSGIDCALMITASHNPWHDNGIKIIDAKSGKLSTEDELIISAALNQQIKKLLREPSTFAKVIPFSIAPTVYNEAVQSLFQTNFLTGKKIVLDLANGATYKVAPAIMRALGATVIALNDTPTGYNINNSCGSLHPEHLQQEVIKYQAFAGFAFDGDGDRVIGVSNTGVLKDGDDILALLSTHKDFKKFHSIVGTILSNAGLTEWLAQQSKKLIRANVGDKYVLAEMVNNGCNLGGEPSGHIIASSLLSTGDGIIIALKCLEAMIETNNHSFETFTKFPQVCINMPVTCRKDLSQSPFNEIIKSSENDIKNGRVLVRYSGTEPLLRIMVENEDLFIAQREAEFLKARLNKAFNCS